MPYKPVLLFTGVAVLAAGCVTVSKSVLTNQYESSPIAEEAVTVLMASMGDSIPTRCVRVAILHAKGNQEWTNEGDVVNKLRSEAGKLGANTVFLQNMEDAGTGERFAGALFGTSVDRDADALALRCP